MTLDSFLRRSEAADSISGVVTANQGTAPWVTAVTDKTLTWVMSEDMVNKFKKEFNDSIKSIEAISRASILAPPLSSFFPHSDLECAHCATVWELHACATCGAGVCGVCSVAHGIGHDIQWEPDPNAVRVTITPEAPKGPPSYTVYRHGHPPEHCVLSYADLKKAYQDHRTHEAQGTEGPPNRLIVSPQVLADYNKVMAQDPKPRYPQGFSWRAYNDGTMKGFGQ